MLGSGHWRPMAWNSLGEAKISSLPRRVKLNRGMIERGTARKRNMPEHLRLQLARGHPLQQGLRVVISCTGRLNQDWTAGAIWQIEWRYALLTALHRADNFSSVSVEQKGE